MKKFSIFTFDPFRLLGFSGFVALGISVLIDVFFGIHNPQTLIPFVEITTFAINFVSMSLCLMIIIWPKQKKYTLLVLLIESIYTMAIGYEFISLTLYGLFLIFLFTMDFYSQKLRLKGFISLIIWILLLLTLIPFGWNRFFLCFGLSFFTFSSYLCIYWVLFQKLSIVPSDYQLHTVNFKLPKVGNILHIAQFPLSQRQIQCVYYLLNGFYTYKEISDLCCISVSVIKKEMLDIYKVFGVQNREMLYFLLSQYTVCYPDDIKQKPRD
ncbi:MAG TPA: helix-turn-helix transcriptional regulator [Treponemataceae bacterium]|nr:helix-turn-helix transcriptional regulator [Treponemataceae bacterium]